MGWPEVAMELLPADLDAAKEMLGVLNMAAAVKHVDDVTIRFRLHNGDWITVGYGLQAEPAVINIEQIPESEVR